MRRILASIFAPLFVMMLMSFNLPSPQEKHTVGKDSSVVSVQFSPAQVVVKDNRSMDVLSEVVLRNTDSNSQIAVAVEKLAYTLEQSSRERRCASLMDRITTQTGLSIKEVEKILHKKRVYDMIAYTLFLGCLVYIYFGFTNFSRYSKSLSINEVLIRSVSYIFVVVITGLILFVALNHIVNGGNYALIESVINSPPG